MYVFTGEEEYFRIFQESYEQILKYSRNMDGFWYRSINTHTGDIAMNHIDSLAAFWPGLQVLWGDIDNAIKTHLSYWNIWQRYSAIPETFDVINRDLISAGYPLRPEFIESTYFLYRATKDPFYLDVGERVLNDLRRRTKTHCGFGTLANVRDGEMNDRMESFMLSETLKYLFLLFDEENPLHKLDSNFIFSTEGHVVILPKSTLRPSTPLPPNTTSQPKHLESVKNKGKRFLDAILRPKHFRKVEKEVENDLRNGTHTESSWLPHHKRQCQVYSPPTFPMHKSPEIDSEGPVPGLATSIYYRPDFHESRLLVGVEDSDETSQHLDVEGMCLAPEVDERAYEFLLGPYGKQDIAEDKAPSRKKLATVHDGFLVHDSEGIRIRVKSRLDGKGYTIVKLGNQEVGFGQRVYFADRSMLQQTTPPRTEDLGKQLASKDAELETYLKFSLTRESRLRSSGEASHSADPVPVPDVGPLTLRGMAASFAHNPSLQSSLMPSVPFEVGKGPLQALGPTSDNLQGCQPHGDKTVSEFTKRREQGRNAVMVLLRGDCPFFVKLKHAKEAGAVGVVTLDDYYEDESSKTASPTPVPIPGLGQNPSAFELEYSEKEMANIGLVIVPYSAKMKELLIATQDEEPKEGADYPHVDTAQQAVIKDQDADPIVMTVQVVNPPTLFESVRKQLIQNSKDKDAMAVKPPNTELDGNGVLDEASKTGGGGTIGQMLYINGLLLTNAVLLI